MISPVQRFTLPIGDPNAVRHLVYSEVPRIRWWLLARGLSRDKRLVVMHNPDPHHTGQNDDPRLKCSHCSALRLYQLIGISILRVGKSSGSHAN